MVTPKINELSIKSEDVIILGCTHYHWIEEVSKTIARGRAIIIHPEDKVVSKVKKALAK